jgi:hypothetical protein
LPGGNIQHTAKPVYNNHPWAPKSGRFSEVVHFQKVAPSKPVFVLVGQDPYTSLGNMGGLKVYHQPLKFFVKA